jgi:pyrroline-5-carboxylate reductase
MSPGTSISASTSKSAACVASADACIGIIGTGTIASLLVRCLSRAFPGRRLLVSGRNHTTLSSILATTEAAIAVSLERLAAEANFVFLAIPPEAYPAVLASMRLLLRPETVVISLTNGIAMSTLGALVDNPIVKVIPTVAQAVGRGCILVAPGPRGDGQPVDCVVGLLSSFSKPVVIDDTDNRVASNVAASALALFAEFASLLVSGHEEMKGRLNKQMLVTMAGETMGAVSDLMANGYSLETIIESTATPGGMTEAALNVLRTDGPGLVRAIISETFRRQRLQQREIDTPSV